MIYDCFIFFNELELLEIRLNTLENVVDKFVIVESTISFSGLNKKPILDKLVVENTTNLLDNLDRETLIQLRNLINQKLSSS